MTDFENDIKSCLTALQHDGVILYPTDTIWGLGCNAFNAISINKIFNIKNRPAYKSMIILLAEPRDILNYVAAPPPDIIDIVSSFDTPTTVIYNGALGFPDNLVNADGSIAIRVTTDPFCKALIKRMRAPLVSTSANLSGAPNPAFFHEIAAPIKSAVDYIVQYRQDDITPRAPSHIITIDDEGNMNRIR